MAKFFHRILFTALTSALLLPLAVQAQQQDPGQSGQTQNSAQPNGTQRRGRMAGGQHMAMLAEKLHLTDAQKEQFQQISKDMRHQGMAIRQDSSLTADQKKEKMLALRKQVHSRCLPCSLQNKRTSSSRCANSTRKTRAKTSLRAIRLQPNKILEAPRRRTTILLPE